MDTDEWGIARRYCDAENHWHETSDETRRRVLEAMSVGPDDRPQTDDCVRLMHPGEQPVLGSGKVTLEDGTTLAIGDRLPPDMPLGYHRFVPDGGERPVLLIVSPGKCRLPPAGGHWCWAAQLYAARS
ncbi:MAG TPA: hypothetical protein VIK18_23190, partial [Pirellulales bacterium]